MVVDRNIGVGHADCSCRRLPGNFRKDTVAFGKDGGNMTASHIVVAELIAGVVVEVGHTRVVCRIVDADHRVFRLYDIQLREMGAHPLILRLIDVPGEPDGSDEGTGVGGVPGSIDTAHRYELVEPCAVILAVYACDAEPVNVGAS